MTIGDKADIYASIRALGLGGDINQVAWRERLSVATPSHSSAGSSANIALCAGAGQLQCCGCPAQLSTPQLGYRCGLDML